MLDERATAVWKAAEEIWDAVSSRVVTARLKSSSIGQRRPSGSRETRNIYVSVVCAYTSAARAPPGIRQKIMEDLQDAI